MISDVIMCLTSHWPIIFSIRISLFVLVISLGEVKGHLFKFPIKLYIILMILLLPRQIETFNIKCHIWNMKNEKFETPQCFIWILMKNMSISYNRSICVNSSTKLLGNGIITGLVIATDIIFGLFQNCFIMHIQSTCI